MDVTSATSARPARERPAVVIGNSNVERKVGAKRKTERVDGWQSRTRLRWANEMTPRLSCLMTRGDSDRGGVTDGYIFTVPKWHNHVFYWIPRRLSPTIVACMSMVTKVFLCRSA